MNAENASMRLSSMEVSSSFGYMNDHLKVVHIVLSYEIPPLESAWDQATTSNTL